jgi:type II secretory pathway pseudopilin PulG
MSLRPLGPQSLGDDESGFGLIDTLVAMMVLGLMLIMSIPAVLVAQSAVRRADALDALRSSAQGQIEEIRALDFGDVGSPGGSPEGIVATDRTITVDGVDIRLQTNIRWEGAASGLAMVDQDGDGTPELGDGVAGFRNIGVDYKAVTVTASRVDEPTRTYEATTIVTPDDLASSGSSAVLVTVVRDEPPASPSVTTDYPTTYLIYPDARWLVTSTPDRRDQSFVDFADPDQIFDVRLGFTSADFDDGVWRLNQAYAVAAGHDFLATTAVTVYKMITLDIELVDVAGVPVSDASITISGPSAATTRLDPADMVSPGRYVVTVDDGGTPLKWGSYSVAVAAPEKGAASVSFDAPTGYPGDLVHEQRITLFDQSADISKVQIAVDDGRGWEVGEVDVAVASPTLGAIGLTTDVDGLVEVDLPEGETATLTFTSSRGFEDTVVAVTPIGATHSLPVSLDVSSGDKVAHVYARMTVGHFTVRPGSGDWDQDLRMEPSSSDRVSVVVDDSDPSWVFRSWCDDSSIFRERTKRFSPMNDPDLLRVDRWWGC